MKRPRRAARRWLAALVLMGGHLLLVPVAGRAAPAQTSYKLKPILQLGGSVGNVPIGDHFDVGKLNDRGQIAFVTGNADGDEILVQYSDGKLIPIVIAGADALGGQWGTNNGVEAPVNMNELGNIVFATDLIVGGNTDVETFLWDATAQTITTLAKRGMPGIRNLTFEAGGGPTPAINNHNDIALVAAMRDSKGLLQDGVFLRSPDGALQPVALPEQVLPDFQLVGHAYEATVNDAGMVGLLIRRQVDGEHMDSAYVWEKGVLTPLALVGQPAPGGGTIHTAWGALVNNKNRNVVVAAQLDSLKGPNVLYRFADGKLTPIAIPGKVMPDGGIFKTLQSDRDGISFANELGQHAFLATLADNSTALYRLDADGQISLMLKSGTATGMGVITQVGVPVPAAEPEGVGVGFNSSGQAAFTARFNGGVTTLVLLSPP